MNVALFLLLAGISLPIFILGDLLWLGVVARDFYQTRLSHLLGSVEWGAAGVFYVLFVIGLTFFATYGAVEEGRWLTALTYGAAFGFFTYMTYDLTNLATLKDWPLSIVVVDIVWGTVLGATVATLTYFIKQLG